MAFDVPDAADTSESRQAQSQVDAKLTLAAQALRLAEQPAREKNVLSQNIEAKLNQVEPVSMQVLPREMSASNMNYYKLAAQANEIPQGPPSKGDAPPSYEQWKGGNSNPEKIKVLTFNIASGNFGLQGVTDLIRNSQADIIGLQESSPVAAKIAKDLGYNYINMGFSSILTRFKIDAVTPGGSGIIAETDNGTKFAFFDKHLYYKPYQPYQLLHIPYENGAFINTEQEAVDESTKARGQDLTDLRKDIATLADQRMPTIVVGDFNEPSMLDWTDAAVQAGHQPLKVEWPVSKTLLSDGFKDAYRQIWPNEVTRPGYTWTPTTQETDPKDHHDRIDFILYKGGGLEVKSATVLGEDTIHADSAFSPFPSDHRAVRAEFELKAVGN